ncbi:MAG: hypothetical protein ACRDL5_05230, partial [Solirubrobacteraceae bacterium]
AGSTANLGLDLKFSPTGTDSPDHLTLDLPPGLLANASIANGSCLARTQTSGATCEVGSGTVTATADVGGLISVPIPVSVPVTFYLVPPPAADDLAGLAVEGLGEQIGQTAGIEVRPTGNPLGVGVTIDLVLPDHLPLDLPGIGQVPLAQISVDEINSTFDGLRYPATCPATPADVLASADSYSDPTVHAVSAPLTVTGCSSLPYSPKFAVTAVRDRSDDQVTVTTDITQAAGQAPSGAVALGLPVATLAPNLGSIRALCLNVSSGSCAVVGSASAASPLYPKPLTGKAYLTGSFAGLSLTLVFPPPFPLTLTGQVNLVNNSASFSGLPDIPLSSLGVSLDGGSDGLFQAICRTPSGTATATVTDVNRDRTVKLPASFTVAGCPGVAGAGGTSGAGAGTGSPQLSSATVSSHHHGRLSLRFRVVARRHRPKLSRLMVTLPHGLSFVGHRGRHDPRVSGVALRGARLRSAYLSHGRLVITLRRAARALTVTIGPAALRESAGVRTAAAAGRLRLTLTVTTVDARGRRSV